MAKLPTPSFFCRGLFLVLCLPVIGSQGFSWGGARAASADSFTDQQSSASVPASALRPSNSYMIALNELQELESEPFCIRIAARLLVSNCRVLDGQDDATVLTNAGKVAQDFVDSFAASLAICDLERGNFEIPSACSPFRESALTRLSPSSKPHLHVTTAEINRCLEGLAQSDSAWNTWSIYKQKAMRFCEAARSDNQKDQTIKVHQKITHILSRLTTQIEEDLKNQFQSFNHMVQDAGKNVESQFDNLGNRFSEMDGLITSSLAALVQLFTNSTSNMGELMDMMFATAHKRNAELVESQGTALRMSNRVNEEMGAVFTTLAAAAVSSLSLQKNMENSEIQAADIVHKLEAVVKIVMNMMLQSDTISRSNEDILKSQEDVLRSNQDILRVHKDLQQHLSDTNQSVAELSQTMATLQAQASRNWMSWLAVCCYGAVSTIPIVFALFRQLISIQQDFQLLDLGRLGGWVLPVLYFFRIRRRNQVTLHDSNEDISVNPTFSSPTFI